MITQREHQFRTEVAFAVAIGMMIFAMLIPVTGGLLAATVITAIAIVIFATAHYVFWGHAFIGDTARERRAMTSVRGVPRSIREPVAFELDDDEVVALTEALEETLSSTSKRSARHDAALRRLLDQLRA
jgi:hypothetical protein